MSIDRINTVGQATYPSALDGEGSSASAVRSAAAAFVGTVIKSLSLPAERKAALAAEWGEGAESPQNFFASIAAKAEGLDVGTQAELYRAADAFAAAASAHLHVHQLSEPATILAPLRESFAVTISDGDIETAVDWMARIAVQLEASG